MPRESVTNIRNCVDAGCQKATRPIGDTSSSLLLCPFAGVKTGWRNNSNFINNRYPLRASQMITKILISLFTVTLLTSCGGSSDSSFSSSGGGTETTASTSGGGTETAASAPSSTTETTPESNASQTSNCAVGRYNFSTVRDGKVHFGASFLQGGMIQFYLKDGPTGSWTYSGNNISVTGPVGNNRSVVTLNFTVTKVASDCKVLEFRGKSQGGSDMRIYRI